MSHEHKTFEKEIVKTVRLEYLLFLPKDYEENKNHKKWPMILFLHGAGERGDDIEKVRLHAIPKRAEADPDFPFIAISPQCPEDSLWEDHFNTLDAILKHMEENYSVDEKRIILTGLSMGGYGTWDFAMVYPGRFAAVVPVCGGAAYPELASILRNVPIWVFHGAKDDIVPISESEAPVEVLKRSRANVRFKIYPDAGHEACGLAYEEDELYKWMLEQRLK